MTTRIELTRGYSVEVDDKDAEWLTRDWKWFVSTPSRNKAYAVGYQKNMGRKRKFMIMHRVIMNAAKGYDVHHVDGNGLNNQRSNLQLLTRKDHSQIEPLDRTSLNTSRIGGYKGVSRLGARARSKPWEARIRSSGKVIRLGLYATAEEAAKAYDLEAYRIYGRDTYLNFGIIEDERQDSPG